MKYPVSMTISMSHTNVKPPYITIESPLNRYIISLFLFNGIYIPMIPYVYWYPFNLIISLSIKHLCIYTIIYDIPIIYLHLSIRSHRDLLRASQLEGSWSSKRQARFVAKSWNEKRREPTEGVSWWQYIFTWRGYPLVN